jgi:DNA-directed RNA polymerase subunit RPC12/RpoP
MFKKKKEIKQPIRRRARVAVDPDIEWYCTECKSLAIHMGKGNWITCPKCGNRDDGKTRKLGAVTRYQCAWCHTTIDPNTVSNGKEPMAMCRHCKKHVHVKSTQTIIKVGD